MQVTECNPPHATVTTDRTAPVLPLRPMSRWFLILMLACASAQAAPDTAPAADLESALHQQRLLSQLVEIRQNVSVQAHEVVDRTSDLVVTAMAILRPKVTTAGMLLPFLLLAAATFTGWHFSLAFAATMLMLVAIVALPADMNRPQRWLLASIAILQAVAAWWLLPWPTPSDADRRDRAVAQALAVAPPRSILLDDRWASGLLKWTPSFAPYLTTRDTGFDIALALPSMAVQYILVTADDDGLSLDMDRRPPVGFVEEWSWSGYTLYRRPAAPRLPVRFTSTLTSETRGSAQ